MSDSPLSPQEIRAAAAAHEELGPEYSDAVVTSFLGRVEDEIAARVDARLAGTRQPPASLAVPDSRATLLKGIAIGIGVSAVSVVAVGGNDHERLQRLLVVLILLAVICAAGRTVHQLGSRRRAERQGPRAAAIPRTGHRPL
jgi:hypothetical protein